MMTISNELKVGEVKKFERHICDPEIWEGEMSCKLPCVDELYRLIEDVPEHIKLSGWFYSKPMFGTQGVYAESFSGNGRQHIMNLPASKAYFGGLAQYIAAVNPRAIKILLDRIKSQQAEREAAKAEIERLSRDASRYQYLRSVDLDAVKAGGIFAGMTPENIVLNGNDLDEAIDNEIVAEALINVAMTLCSDLSDIEASPKPEESS